MNAIEITVTNKAQQEYYDDSLGITDTELLEYYKKRLVVFDVNVKNVSGEDLLQVEGDLVLKVGMYTLNLTCVFEDPIAAGETVTYSAWGFEYSPKYDSGVLAKNAVYEANLEDIDFSFMTTDNIFENQDQESSN